MKHKLWALGFWAISMALPIISEANAIVIKSFNGMNKAQAGNWEPSDMGGAVGPNQVVQFVNNAFQVFDKSGTSLTPVISAQSFWTAAGISSGVLSPGLSDPRIIYDADSQRYFAVQINVAQTANVGNRVLLAVSNSSDASAGFKAVDFAGLNNLTGTAPLADYPTLGISQNGVYIGTNNFTNNTTFSGVSLFSIPKADLLSVSGPYLSNMTRFDNLNANTRGFTLQAASGESTTGTVLAIDNVSFNKVDITRVTGSGGAGAVMSATSYLTGITDGSPNNQRQPDGTRTLDGLDQRFGSAVFQSGHYLYAANAIGDSQNPNLTTHDMVHWMILDANTLTLLVQGVISDPNYDFTFPSIAANDYGDFMIAYNGSSQSSFVSDYADICHFNGISVICETPLLLQTGLGNYHGGFNRWGDYSAAQVDPANPKVFWAFLGYPLANNQWATSIAAIMEVPEPSTLYLLCLGLASLRLGTRRIAS